MLRMDMAVATDGDLGCRPVAADAAHEVLEDGADLDATGRFSLAQDDHDRLAAFDVIDVAPGSVTGPGSSGYRSAH